MSIWPSMVGVNCIGYFTFSQAVGIVGWKTVVITFTPPSCSLREGVLLTVNCFLFRLLTSIPSPDDNKDPKIHNSTDLGGPKSMNYSTEVILIIKLKWCISSVVTNRYVSGYHVRLLFIKLIMTCKSTEGAHCCLQREAT